MKLARALNALAIIAGLALALAGLALDSLLPGGQPGLGLPQLLIVAAGVLLAGFGWQLLVGVSLAAQLRENWLKMTLISLITLLGIEIVLSLAGLSTYYPPALAQTDLVAQDWWSCDDMGCRYAPESARRACQSGDLSGRHCVFNNLGFADSDDFVASAELARGPRIIVLGDSFTHGFTADPGKSYVETVESLLPAAAVWNLGISGTSVNQAHASYRHIAPLMKPQLTILAFFPWNDFLENSQAYTEVAATHMREASVAIVRTQLFDRRGAAWFTDAQTVLRYLEHDLRPPPNELERLLGMTRLGSLFLRGLDMLSPLFAESAWQSQVKATRGYLRALQDEVAANGSQLLTLVIPAKADFVNPPREYTAAIDLFAELGIPYMLLKDELRVEEDYMVEDGHWNNAGHGKVGEIVADCVEAFFAAGSLSACDSVVFP